MQTTSLYFREKYAVLEEIGEAILYLDKEGYIRFANQALCDMFGYSLEELQEKHISILYIKDKEHIRSNYEMQQLHKNGRLLIESYKQKKDGSQIWVEMHFTVSRRDGDETVYNCVIRNTEERKANELLVRKSEESYRLMVEAVRDYAIFLLDVNGNIVTWNEGAQRIKGYTFNEIKGKHFSTFYTSADLQSKKPERELKIAMAEGKYEEEGWRVRKNGSVFWANVVITALYNEQNKHIGFSKVTRDLSDRKEKEEQLRQSEERYRALVEQVTDYGIFMLDEKGRIMSWNEGAKKIKGYQSDEVLGKYFTIFYPAEDIMNNKPATELKLAIENGKYEEEGWRLKKDGSRFWANVVITPVYNNNNLLIGFSKVTRDLTERKDAEKALQDSYEKMRYLAQELKFTNSELTYANQELEQFTSIVSHDLQEPVRTIKSFLQFIENKIAQNDLKDLPLFIAKCSRAANKMRDLIQGLLSYSQLSRDIDPESRVNTSEILQEATQNLRGAIEKSGATIIITCTDHRVKGDALQLTQLFQNLIGNALKFTKPGEIPEVKVECVNRAEFLQFSVVDKGIGIAPEDQHKVFEIFRRLHTDREYSGTGIGLAICKRIVDRHGGKIWLESEKGKGTIFYFTLLRQEQD